MIKEMLELRSVLRDYEENRIHAPDLRNVREYCRVSDQTARIVVEEAKVAIAKENAHLLQAVKTACLATVEAINKEL